MGWWRRTVALALLLIVTGSPARQAEAASDLARTVGEIDAPSRVEEIDGGVGDDQIEAPRPDVAAPGAAAALVGGDWAELAAGNAPLGLVARACLVCPDLAWSRVDLGRTDRLAWLQRFRC